MLTGWLAHVSVLLLSQRSCFRKFVSNAKKLMCSGAFHENQIYMIKGRKKQNFITKPSQFPEKYTIPMQHIHHSTTVWLDPVYNGDFKYLKEFCRVVWIYCRLSNKISATPRREYTCMLPNIYVMSDVYALNDDNPTFKIGRVF